MQMHAITVRAGMVSTIGRTGVLVHAMMHVSAMPGEANRWR